MENTTSNSNGAHKPEWQVRVDALHKLLDKLGEEITRGEERSKREFIRMNKVLDRQAAEADRRAAEFAAEFNKRAAESAAAADKRAAESSKRGDEFDKQLKEVGRKLDSVAKKYGGFVNTEGEILENEFAMAMWEEKNIAGVLDKPGVIPRLMTSKREYDIICVSNDAVCLAEIKRKFIPWNVEYFVNDQFPTFIEDLPYILHMLGLPPRERKVYGFLGGKIIPPDAEEAAKHHGLFTMRLKNKNLRIGNIGRVQTQCFLPSC